MGEKISREVHVFFVVAAVFAAALAGGRSVGAQEVSVSSPQVIERKIFHLDWGFVGRSVRLEMEDGSAVAWEAGDLSAPTILMVERERWPVVSANGAELMEDVLHITWADPYLLSARGVQVFMPYACQPDAFTKCFLHQSLGGTEWREVGGGRVYGHIRTRMAKKTLPYMKEGKASWYAYKKCLCAASPDFPKGTRVRVRSVSDPAKFVVVRINDWGPERDKHPERAIDLDAVAFKKLAPLGAGVISVTVEPLLPTDPDYRLADQIEVVPTTTVAAIVKPVASTEPEKTWSY